MSALEEKRKSHILKNNEEHKQRTKHMSNNHVQTVKDFFAAIGRGDIQRLLALCAEDIEWIIPGEDWPLAGTRRGHAGLADLLQTASETMEISFMEPREFVAQGDRVLVVGFASLSPGYMCDIPSGMKFRGQAIGDAIAAFASAFPDVHRELFSIYVAENVVVVELAIRGTHKGELALASRTLAPTGKAIDVPCCDVFHLESGKVISFNCYNAASVMQQQLGLASS
jgi:ketosteroid isomerase-like protein